MEIKQFTKSEMIEIEKQEEGSPIRKRWYKHISKEIYQYQLSILETSNFQEVIKCKICNKIVDEGRQCLHTGDIICDSTSCAGEYYLENTSRIGDTK